MKSWTLIPHFYQPPTQSLILTEQVLRSCYLPFLDILLNHPEVEVSVNFSASLILQLERIHNHDFFSKLKTLVERNQIEFLNSAIFHPILPITPPDVIQRQIKENTTVLERFTSISPVPGFFPPELAIDEKTIQLLEKTGVEFVIVDESSVNPDFNLNIINKPAIQKCNNLTLLVSSRSLTELFRSYPTELKAEQLIKFIEGQISNDQLPIICATDVEVFGHHYSERVQLLKDLFDSKKFKFIKATTALDQAKSTKKLEIKNIAPSSWQTSVEDLKSSIPFSLWNSKTNPLQQKYYQLAEMAYRSLFKVESETTTENISHTVHSAQNHFDQGISSCHSYWLSNKPWWHPDMVDLGAKNLIKCIRSLPIEVEKKQQAENFYHSFMLEVWSYHWSGQVEKNYMNFDQKRLETLKNLPHL